MPIEPRDARMLGAGACRPDHGPTRPGSEGSRLWTRLASLHGDQQGTISILTVFTVLLLTMVLGMVMNVGREVDGKIRLQNAADAAAYSGGVVIARGMNTLAFTNNLLCEIIGMVGYMREARDRNAEKYVPSILAAWDQMAPEFNKSKHAKLRAMATAIPQKTRLEQEIVRTFSDWGQASSEQILPFVEAVLRLELIPQFQRAVVEAYPDIAQRAAMEAAQHNSAPEGGRGKILGVLWRTSGVPVGYDSEAVNRSFPVVDPILDALPGQEAYVATAKRQRHGSAHHFLRLWNDRTLAFFDYGVKMSYFARLWRGFSGGYVNEVLEKDYPTTNLPFVIRTLPEQTLNPNAYLEEFFTFVAVVYWQEQPRTLPGLFHNPTGSDAEAFAQVRVFIPKRRLEWQSPGGKSSMRIGGMPGDMPSLPDEDQPSTPEPREGRYTIGRQGTSERWNLFNQNWTTQLVPATAGKLAAILQTAPPIPEFGEREIRLPSLGSLDSDDIGRISTH